MPSGPWPKARRRSSGFSLSVTVAPILQARRVLWGLGSRVQGLGRLGFWGLGFRIWGFRIWGFRVGVLSVRLSSKV